MEAYMEACARTGRKVLAYLPSNSSYVGACHEGVAFLKDRLVFLVQELNGSMDSWDIDIEMAQVELDLCYDDDLEEGGSVLHGEPFEALVNAVMKAERLNIYWAFKPMGDREYYRALDYVPGDYLRIGCVWWEHASGMLEKAENLIRKLYGPEEPDEFEAGDVRAEKAQEGD